MKPVSHNLLAYGFLKNSVCGRVPVSGGMGPGKVSLR